MGRINRVILDPGHGGMNPTTGRYTTAGKQFHFVGEDGTAEFSIYEGAQQRLLATWLAGQLEAEGIEVYSSLTGVRWVPGHRWTHEDVPLSVRVATANWLSGPGTLFLSLHSNAISKSSTGTGASARGICVYTSRGQTGADPIADAIWEALGRLAPPAPQRRANRRPDGDPDYEAGFYVLKNTTAPAVLVELGFHDNREDARWLLSSLNLRAAAECYTRGVLDYNRGQP